MNFFLLAACAALLAFTLVDVLLSVLVEGLWRLRARHWRHRSGRWLFLLRVAPAALSVAFVTLAFVPSFLAHEPRDSQERVNLWLAFAAGPGLGLLAIAGARAFATWQATRKAVRNWRRAGRPVAIAGWSGPAYRVGTQAPGPGVFVTGCYHPTLFVTRSVETACTGSELAAIVAHERAHILARDNLKRFVMRCLPDVLGLLPSAAEIERAWVGAVEDEADDQAMRAGDTAGVELASAIVKVSRLACAPSGGWGTSPFHRVGPIARRVRRLTAAGRPITRSAGAGSRIAWLALSLPGIVSAVPDFSVGLHRVSETVVQFLTNL